MLNFLKYISAVSLLSVSSFASESIENCFCADAHLPSTVSLLDHVQHIDSAVYSHHEIEARHSQDEDITGYLGTFIEKSLPNESNLCEIKHVYNCIITNPTTAIIRNYIGAESEAHDLEIRFANGKITEVYKIDHLHNKDLIADSSLIGSDAPKKGRISLNDKVGESSETYVTLEEDGSINLHEESIFNRIENAQEKIEQIIKDIAEQKPELIQAIVDQTTTEFEKFQDDFNNQQYDFIQKYMEKIEETYNKLTIFSKHENDILEEHLKHDHRIQTEAQNDFITKQVRVYSDSTNASIALHVDKMNKYLHDCFDKTLDDLFATRIGISKNDGTLLKRISPPYFTQTDFIDTMNMMSQMLREYHVHPGFYIGNIEIMIFGQHAPLTKTLGTTSVAEYIELACERARNIAGKPEYSTRLEQIKKSMSSIINFLKIHDLNKEYTVSVALKKLFGEKFPLYEPSCQEISNYCAAAQFNEEDYGFYGWIRNVASLLDQIVFEQHKIVPDKTSHELLDLEDRLDNLLEGNIRITNIIDQSTSIQHVMPDVFHKDLKNYEEILKYCEKLVHNAENHSLENHFLEQNKHLKESLDQVHSQFQSLDERFSKLQFTVSDEIQSINNEIRNLENEISKNSFETKQIYKAQRLLIYHILGFDISKPQGSISLDDRIRQLDDPKNPSISACELHEAAHPHHRDYHMNHPIYMPDNHHSSSPSRGSPHHHHYHHSPIFKK